jgi:ABC-type nickel/cobalt efflux system permease component RcnA
MAEDLMPNLSLLTTLALGFVLGLRHALDADHIAAVAALTESRGGLRRALVNGMSWGMGHALTIGLAGGTAIVLRSAFPERLALAFELAAALMLIVLGAVALRGAVRDRLHLHAHRHGDVAHAHLHFHAVPHDAASAPVHDHSHPVRLALRPFLVGTVHGLAGSAALAILVLATMPTVLAGCVYLVVFGSGTMVGMALMSLVLSAPFVLAERRAVGLSRALRGAAGFGSLAVGLLLGWQAGSACGLFG